MSKTERHGCSKKKQGGERVPTAVVVFLPSMTLAKNPAWYIWSDDEKFDVAMTLHEPYPFTIYRRHDETMVSLVSCIWFS